MTERARWWWGTAPSEITGESTKQYSRQTPVFFGGEMLESGFAFWIFSRGGIAGDPTADEIILRVVTGFLGGMALIRLVTLFTGQTL